MVIDIVDLPQKMVIFHSFLYVYQGNPWDDPHWIPVRDDRRGPAMPSGAPGIWKQTQVAGESGGAGGRSPKILREVNSKVKNLAWKEIRSGKLTVCYGKSLFLMGKSTMSVAIFNSELLNYQRVNSRTGDERTMIWCVFWRTWLNKNQLLDEFCRLCELQLKGLGVVASGARSGTSSPWKIWVKYGISWDFHK